MYRRIEKKNYSVKKKERGGEVLMSNANMQELKNDIRNSSLVSYVSNNSCNADLTERPVFNTNTTHHLGQQKSLKPTKKLL